MMNCLFKRVCLIANPTCSESDLVELKCKPIFIFKETPCTICGSRIDCLKPNGQISFCLECSKIMILPRIIRQMNLAPEQAQEVLNRL